MLKMYLETMNSLENFCKKFQTLKLTQIRTIIYIRLCQHAKNCNPSKDIYDSILDLEISSKFSYTLGFLSSCSFIPWK